MEVSKLATSFEESDTPSNRSLTRQPALISIPPGIELPGVGMLEHISRSSEIASAPLSLLEPLRLESISAIAVLIGLLF
ncbi:uncharacterized protein RCC_05055 [Ramularia collo-cygni]|uniref:Uncharacterized protein n=1 Tax=Ramularia collo-cygni TaxID=112498 RepID=A0A2D3VC65_9PEZI|nr:uncharacterized protein RCC_05055 [Ramularia collo-cygni]CZT19209.1 uncharacterized protein RCC_05055 [Ramularia collo-cygni]